MSHHKWVGLSCRFIKSKHAEEYAQMPALPLAESRGWTLKGDIVEMILSDPVNDITTYLCTVRGRKSGKCLIVNSTLQYLRIIDG